MYGPCGKIITVKTWKVLGRQTGTATDIVSSRNKMGLQIVGQFFFSGN